MTNKDNIEEKIKEWREDFEDQYGLEDPTRTFRDYDDMLIIRDNLVSFLRQALAEQSTLHQREMELLKEEIERGINEIDIDSISGSAVWARTRIKDVIDKIINSKLTK